jgi:RNA polymerase sigma-70 factor, ECF subfamily
MTESTALEDRLARLVAEARRAWPPVLVSDTSFLTYLAARIPAGVDLGQALEELRTSDLYLACACGCGDPAALLAFDAAFMGEVDAAHARIRPAGLQPDDARQTIRQKLFVSDGVRPPRIHDYSGRGTLKAWVRATAVRTMIDLARERRRDAEPVDEGDFARVPSPRIGPELEYLKRTYQAEFVRALADATAALPPRQRNLLRQSFVHDLSIDEIGVVYRVHRTTAARWLAKARHALLTGTRLLLMQRLDVRPVELDSIMRLVDSGLELSLRQLLPSVGPDDDDDRDETKDR